MTGIAPWIKTVFAIIVIVTVLNGICGVVISCFDRPVWNRHRLVTGMALSVIGSAVFIMTRQPYAGILFFMILIIKGLLLFRKKYSKA